MSYKIINILKKEQDYLRSHYGIKRLAVFGSITNGHFTSKSDVDLLVEFNKKPTGLKFFEMADYIEKKIGRKTDILTTTGINTIRSKRIADSIKKNLHYV